MKIKGRMSKQGGSEDQIPPYNMANLGSALLPIEDRVGLVNALQKNISLTSTQMKYHLKRCKQRLQQLSGHGASDDVNVRKNV